MNGIVIRAGRLDDGEAIARVHVATWQTAYRGLLPDEMLDALKIEDRIPRWTATLNHPENLVLVAESGGGVVGFLAARRSPDDESGQTGELDAIYILESFAGRGIGAAMMERSDQWMRDHGFTRAVLWVLPANVRTRRFYEAHGWTDNVEERTLHIQGAIVPARRYVKSLWRPFES